MGEKICCTYTVEHITVIKTDEVLQFAAVQMKMDITVLNKVIQTLESKYHVILPIQNAQKLREEYWCPRSKNRDEGEMSKGCVLSYNWIRNKFCSVIVHRH